MTSRRLESFACNELEVEMTSSFVSRVSRALKFYFGDHGRSLLGKPLNFDAEELWPRLKGD